MIAAQLTKMLKTTRLFEELTSKAFKASNDKVVGGGGDRTDETMRNLYKYKKLKNDKSRNLIRVTIIRAMGEPIFLTSNAKKSL